MNLHECQAKELFKEYGIPVPAGGVAREADEALELARALGGPVVVKAQIHAGGRGKAGGVKLTHCPEEARDAACALLGKKLVTGQTGPNGEEVRLLLIEKSQEIAEEFYAGITLDRIKGQPALIVSRAGGMDIEQVAEEKPEAILRLPIDPLHGLADFEARKAAAFLGLAGATLHEGARLLKNLYRLYDAIDAMLAEINPLAKTRAGQLVALDAKLNIDDNALFRQPGLMELEDKTDSFGQEAERYGLNYIKLDGDIGVMVNGAGLAMATMDLVKQAGKEPANFLDVGGGARAEKIAAGFNLILADPNVRAIFINIFGGILRCDFLASGVVTAARETALNVPLIVRMRGTNADQGREILEQSGLQFAVAEDLADAARLVAEVDK